MSSSHASSSRGARSAPAANAGAGAPAADAPSAATRALALAAKERGNAAFALGDLDLARREYAEAARLDDTDPANRGNLANARLLAGDAIGALADAQAVVARSPLWPRGHGRLCAALSALGRHDEAVAAIARGLALPPGAVSAWLLEQQREALAARERASTATR